MLAEYHAQDCWRGHLAYDLMWGGTGPGGRPSRWLWGPVPSRLRGPPPGEEYLQHGLVGALLMHGLWRHVRLCAAPPADVPGWRRLPLASCWVTTCIISSAGWAFPQDVFPWGAT